MSAPYDRPLKVVTWWLNKKRLKHNAALLIDSNGMFLGLDNSINELLWKADEINSVYFGKQYGLEFPLISIFQNKGGR
jgi:hypothetical protein